MALTVLVALHWILYPLAFWHFYNWVEALCYAVAAPILLFYPLQFLFTTLPRWILVHINRSLRDFHYTTGHWGLSAKVGFEHGRLLVGPVLYPVFLTFSNPDSARRFLEAHPQAEVVLKKKHTHQFS